MQFTKAKLCWAALTAGKPKKVSVKEYAQYSHYEALFRWNMVKASIDFSHPPLLHNSALFDALDPTEKGGINYYLGMIATKLCADRALGVSWLIHYDWMVKNHEIEMKPGKSTPDLLGLGTNGLWNVFEAKGRNRGFLESVADTAKTQADMAISVDGVYCDLHVGGLLFREATNGQFAYHWRDPTPDQEKRIDLKTDRDTWAQYYALPYYLAKANLERPAAAAPGLGFTVSLADDAFEFAKIVIETDQDYSNQFGILLQNAQRRREADQPNTNADGVIVKLIEEE
ncbi:hypothetical protein [uncultured Hyphomonas sp.]|uniref:hypothetical protein n=1 Tax=uncultured Hyphomonas sp. TaxID=225298 RepID=UPI002AAB453A|nr:hypothetical protein [uncultured Hyphomonas sp.]